MVSAVIEQLNQRREEIAKYDEKMLNMLSVTALRKLASGIVPGTSKMKKPELVEALIACTKAERAIVAIIPDIPLSAIEKNIEATEFLCENVNEDLAQWTTKFFYEFRKVVETNYVNGEWNDDIHRHINAFAYRVVLFLNQRDGNSDNGGLALTTKLRYRTHICNLLIELTENERDLLHYKQLKSCLDSLITQIKFQISDLTAQKKGLQERRLAERKQEKEVISFRPLHEFALTVLGNLDKLRADEWRKVSVALAIVTGRRLAEIHLVSTKFEYVDKRTCNFTGQLKTKGCAEDYFKMNPSYPIPVLVDAKLVCDAHQWLRNNFKVVADSKVAANRYTKDLSEAMKILKKRFGIEHEFFTYKGLRSIYAQVCNQVFNDNDSDNILYLAEILGHGRGELLRNDRLIDTSTPQSYNSDFKVKDTDCVVF